VNFFPLSAWLRSKKFRERLAAWLKDERSTEKLAASLALGFVLGLFPVFGIPTVLCGAAAALWRLNLPALQLMNYLAYPLQIALLWPFARLGGALFGVSHGLRGLAGLTAMALHTAVAWFCFAAPAGLILYFGLHQILRWQAARIS